MRKLEPTGQCPTSDVSFEGEGLRPSDHLRLKAKRTIPPTGRRVKRPNRRIGPRWLR